MSRQPKKKSKRNADWIQRHCRIPEGKFGGRPAKLTKEQVRWLELIYDSPTRTFILSMGRKNAKTTFAAFLLLLHLVGPEAIPNSQLFSAAQSRDQAALIFDLAAKVVRLSPDLGRWVTIKDTAKQLLCSELGTIYRALSAEASTAFGLSPAFVVHDELGQVRGPRSTLFDALETAAAAQESPLSIIISTQAAGPEDLFSTLIDDALEKPDPRTKIALYTAPIDDDPFQVQTIRKANPHFDSFMNKEEVMKQAEEARRMPSRESAYRNLILNQRVESVNPFVSRDVWKSCGAPPKEIAGRPVWCGLDLSSVADLTAFVALTADGDIHPTFWLPEAGIIEKSRVDKVAWDVWAKQGFLKLTPGRAIEYAYVADFLKKFMDANNVQAVAFDRYNMRFLKPWLERAGMTPEQLEKFVEFGQGFVSMSPALREMETKLLGAKYRHGNHPVLTMCAASATVVKDPAGNRKFAKNKSSGKIDGMVALAMAEGAMPHDHDPDPEYNIFFV